jgi:hypothetical protein
MTLEQVLSAASQLNEIDKLRLIRQLIMDMELTNVAQPKQPRISSLGALAHLGTAPSEAEIDEVRREMCANFGEAFGEVL